MLIKPFQSTEKFQAKGVLYSNDGMVEHTLENGITKEITPSEGSSNTLKTYIRPELIAVQINAYVGDNFTSSDLTVEGVKKTTIG